MLTLLYCCDHEGGEPNVTINGYIRKNHPGQ